MSVCNQEASLACQSAVKKQLFHTSLEHLREQHFLSLGVSIRPKCSKLQCCLKIAACAPVFIMGILLLWNHAEKWTSVQVLFDPIMASTGTSTYHFVLWVNAHGRLQEGLVKERHSGLYAKGKGGLVCPGHIPQMQPLHFPHCFSAARAHHQHAVIDSSCCLQFSEAYHRNLIQRL